MATEISGSTGVNKIQDGTITNADINASAAIAGSKLLGVGKVLQVVQASTTTLASQGGTTYASAGLSGTITPTSSSSKILIMVTQYYTFRTNTTSERQAFFRLMRGSTEIMETVYDRIAVASGENRVGTTATFNWLDSPNTTSAITYSTQFKLNGTASDLYAQHDNAQSIITFLEIGV